MSYNVTTTKVKRLEGLKIPLQALTDAEKDYDEETLTSTFSFGECSNIVGKEIDGFLIVESFEWYSEFSGKAYNDSLLPALKQSTGVFEAVFIWEGGDYIERLTSVDGEVKEEEVDL